MMASFRVAIL
jgi:hypothetical protein